MTDQLVYPIEQIPETGQSVEVAPGVLWIRMPMPFRLSHVNVWALRDGDGWVVVDCGLQTVDITSAWRQLLDSNGDMRGLPVHRVIATHMHPDHVGMAGWLTRRFDCLLSMTWLEYLTCRVLTSDTGREAPHEGVRFYRQAGWSEADIDNYRTRFGGFGKMIHQLPDSFFRLKDGDQLRIGEHEWEVVVGYGHSPEHACLYCRDLKLLISGDQILPKITSNVSVHPTEPQANPLAEWLETLTSLRRRVDDDVIVLPAHNEPFRGLHRRIEQLEQSTYGALDRLRNHLRSPRRIVDVFDALFKRPIGNDAYLLPLATGESLANINFLLRAGEVVAVDTVGEAIQYVMK